ncbi:hypothetical protein N7519_004886 [Penicillium mononematosum]|uniref:uncharacterized protein n=1 Tax=Penicillium mononematosum TaxID=268346 RepID=UPI0025472F86|nr:uncharacterized protein N7519_004886 [Penicillium mononematosum]KAJ6189978.1 hypothetical protein N7519_004886 [Penicillium mononematosum]
MNSSPQNPTSPLGSGNRTVDHALDISVVVLISIALYNALELAILILLSFRRYRSLYFWSLLTSAIGGVIPSTIGGFLQFFNLVPLWLSLVLQIVGWVLMVPNQSVVLYSRLHLVSQSRTTLGFVRALIILCLIVIVVPTIVLNVGWTYMPQSPAWVQGYAAYERIQVTWFTLQECFISGVYIWEAVRIIRLTPRDDKWRHKILYELLAVNVAIIVMDLAVIILQYLSYYFSHLILKATVYSVKLKLEYAVLSLLVSIVHSRGSERQFWPVDRTTSNIPSTWSVEAERLMLANDSQQGYEKNQECLKSYPQHTHDTCASVMGEILGAYGRPLLGLCVDIHGLE